MRGGIVCSASKISCQQATNVFVSHVSKRISVNFIGLLLDCVLELANRPSECSVYALRFLVGIVESTVRSKNDLPFGMGACLVRALLLSDPPLDNPERLLLL